MIRRAFGVAVATICLLSFVLCAGSAWLWRQSYERAFFATWAKPFTPSAESPPIMVPYTAPDGADGWRPLVVTPDGPPRLGREIWVQAYDGVIRADLHIPVRLADDFRRSDADVRWGRFSFTWYDRQGRNWAQQPRPAHGFMYEHVPTVAIPSEVWTVMFPAWFAVAVFALPPVLWLGTAGRRRFVLRRRRKLGRCAGCGYDLTANVSGKCPECGAEANRSNYAFRTQPS